MPHGKHTYQRKIILKKYLQCCLDLFFFIVGRVDIPIGQPAARHSSIKDGKQRSKFENSKSRTRN